MEYYILDANLFFNMQAGLNFGQKTEAVVNRVADYAKQLAGKASFLMPPRVVDEFLSFFEDKEQLIIKRLLSSIIIKAPDYNNIEFSSTVFMSLVEDVRKRNYTGLNIAEELIEEAGKKMIGKETKTKQQFQQEIGVVIKTFRERYRHATRSGFLDSVADLDLIVLAKELDGFLVSTDEGVIQWGRVFGVKEMPVGVWQKRLDDLHHHRE